MIKRCLKGLCTLLLILLPINFSSAEPSSWNTYDLAVPTPIYNLNGSATFTFMYWNNFNINSRYYLYQYKQSYYSSFYLHTLK